MYITVVRQCDHYVTTTKMYVQRPVFANFLASLRFATRGWGSFGEQHAAHLDYHGFPSLLLPTVICYLPNMHSDATELNIPTKLYSSVARYHSRHYKDNDIASL